MNSIKQIVTRFCGKDFNIPQLDEIIKASDDLRVWFTRKDNKYKKGKFLKEGKCYVNVFHPDFITFYKVLETFSENGAECAKAKKLQFTCLHTYPCYSVQNCIISTQIINHVEVPKVVFDKVQQYIKYHLTH